MRKFLLVIMIFSVAAVYGQRKPKIKGSREVIEVRESLLPFSRLVLADDIEITLEKASEPGYVIRADDNLVDIFKFRVEDSTLVITSFYKVRSKKKLEIIVKFNGLNSISAEDGYISSKDVIASDLVELQLKGSAKMKIDARAALVQLDMKGNSSGEFNIDSDSLQLYAKDKADLKLYTNGETIALDMAENSRARLEGRTGILQANLRDNADLKAEKMEAGVARAVLSGSPSAEINVSSDFELDSSGSSKTYLYGSPVISISAFRDSSVLTKRGN
ncbi:GIN domain-containing protein [Zeaxanthinibacter enoshimensis]|uniref:GIN domain-containing protein n=1 Tax=Zeaxanthinibacter enoshimensis TaxID=392009 RepID=UPI0035679BBB